MSRMWSNNGNAEDHECSRASANMPPNEQEIQTCIGVNEGHHFAESEKRHENHHLARHRQPSPIYDIAVIHEHYDTLDGDNDPELYAAWILARPPLYSTLSFNC